MPQTLLAVVLLIILLLGIYGLMVLGWRRRARRQGEIQAPMGIPETFAPTASQPAVYVSSTVSGDWLDRIVAHTLGQRSNALVEWNDHSVAIRREGAQDIYILAGDLITVASTNGMAGKFVGKQGVIVVTWSLAGTALDTGLHIAQRADSARVLDALSGIISLNPPADDRVAHYRAHLTTRETESGTDLKTEEA